MPEQTQQIPSEVQTSINVVCDFVIENAKKDYNNPLQPFKQYAEKVRLDWSKLLTDVYLNNRRSQIVLKEYLQKEEQENPDIPEEARWATWEKTSHEIRDYLQAQTAQTPSQEDQKSIQERFGISWNFMNRVYFVAEKLIEEGKCDDAVLIFDVLIFLHPLVPDYWIRRGAALFGSGQFEAALDQYVFSLIFNPDEPTIFFEMSRCYFQLKELEPCLKSLDACLKYCGQEERYADLMAKAKTIKRAIESKQLRIEGEAK